MEDHEQRLEEITKEMQEVLKKLQDFFVKNAVRGDEMFEYEIRIRLPGQLEFEMITDNVYKMIRNCIATEEYLTYLCKNQPKK